MKKFKIYYHNDMDGMCSRVIAEKIIRQRYGNSEDFVNSVFKAYELSHSSTDIDAISKITGDETLVIFVDYAFTDNALEVFKEILRKTDNGQKLLWIDHHDSSVKFVEDHIFPNGTGEFLDIPSGSFIVSKSGSAAYLTWAAYQSETFITVKEHKFHRGTMFPYFEVYDMYKKAQFVPPVVRYVSDYDTFEHRISYTDEFKLGYDTHIDKYNFMQGLFNFSGGWDSEEIREHHPDKWACFNKCTETVSIGTTIMNYIKAENQNVIKMQGYESCIKNLKTGQMEPVYVCNRFSNSWVFGELYNKYRYVVVYYFTGTEHKYSIFSNLKVFSDTDCCKYAEQFGGGGHKGAAGWRSKELMFLKDTFVFDGMESWLSSNTRSVANGCRATCMGN